ncbi:hypothetical protein KA047_02965 [Candidatus Saccharibacteria bacterium]|nr:hypothetical protein [Candidatus Saccharibacteria bacterium]
MNESAPNTQPHAIPGINEAQANTVVERAYQNNALRELLDHESSTVAETARGMHEKNEEIIGALAGQTALSTEVAPVPAPETPAVVNKTPDAPPRRRKTERRVVDPRSGRIVRYGQMRPGNHPNGGRLVR